MKKLELPSWLLFAALVFSTGSLLLAQSNGSAQIAGVITDPTGAVIPNAEVKAIQTNTGQIRTTVSGSNGSYVLPNLAVGPYSLEVIGQGFQRYVNSGITLEVGNQVTVNVSLRLGDTNQAVQVTADAAMVQTQDTSVSEVVDQRRIIDLPLNGRQATDLILLAGGAIKVPTASFGGANALVTTKNYPGSAAVSVGGGQATGNNYVMDGADNNDTFSNVNLPFPFPDALQEFSVQTNGLSAQFGIHPGTVVNVVTKSGANQIHGDLFEFVRNGDFNARNFFAATQDTLRRNQFGGTVGAPIKKDKLFGFFGYQRTFVRTAPPQSISFVPTDAARSGDFSSLESAGCQSTHTHRAITDPTTGQPFPNDFVPPSLFSPQAVNLAKYLPTVNNPCGQITYAIPNPSDESQYIGRVDWNQSSKNTFFSRYFLLNFNNPPLFDGKNGLTTTLAGQSVRSQSLVLGDNYSFSPSIINSARITGTRLRDNRSAASNLFTLADAGVNIYEYDPHFINLSVSGAFAFGCGNCATAHFNRNVFQFADSVDIIHGRHQISLGADYGRLQFNEFNLLDANGTISFNGQVTKDAMLDFLLGKPASLTQIQPDGMAFRQNYIGVYAQDNFQVTRRLNVHFGVRWEPFMPERDNFGRGSFFSQSDFVAGTKTAKYTNAPPGLFFNGDPGIPYGYINNQYGNFSPRLGLAWDPRGNGHQSIRASYGIFYDRPNTFFNAKYADAPPWGNKITTPSPAGGLANPYAGYPGGNPFPAPLPPAKDAFFPSGGVYVNFPIDTKPTYVQQWGLSYQVQVGNDWLLSANYIGNKSTHLWAQYDANHAIYIPGNCNSSPCSTLANVNQRRTLTLLNPATGPLFGAIDTLDDGVNANYNAVIIKAQHRFSQNFTLLASYTYSHCLQDSQLVVNDLGNGPLYQNPLNRNADYGACDFDMRHSLVASLLIVSPKLTNKLANTILGAWQLSPIITAHGGFPFTPTSGQDNSRTGEGADRPNIVGNPYVRNLDTRVWLNPAAFAPNTIGAFGNAGWNSLRGPGGFNIDVGLSRSFRIRESQSVQLRFEFFNTTNHVNFNNPGSNINVSNFGTILSAQDPRILQFALKYMF
jgi:Carboxypeptidase regulatory-like domain/TonB dependent receptor